MARIQSGRSRFSSRPLYTTLFILTLLATYTIFLGGPHLRTSPPTKSIFARAGHEVCDDVHEAIDQCAFVKANCAEDEPGLLSYLSFYYCVLPKAKPVAFALLALWLGLLFSTIGIAASDFFSVNLSTIASVLRLPESLAGVTFLAFGNGSPDVFSTFAAMGSNSGSMAVGELIGAAGFISAVVAGSMALVREFKVSRKTFVRDIVFFILAVSFTMLFLLDGKMHLWECGAMIAFYLFYVCFVFAWQWVSARRRRRKTKEAASRSHYSVASIHLGDDVEPYHDNLEEDEEDGNVGQRRRSSNIPDISALDPTPVIDIESKQDDDDEDRERHLASEMTSSMRVNRPRGRRTHSTVAPIRPSLVGALEFRSVLSSLTRSRNMRLAPLQRGYSDHNSAGLLARSSTDLDHMEPYRDDPTGTQSLTHLPARDRALSSGDVPRHLPSGGVEYTPWFGQSRESSCQPPGSVEQGREGRSPSARAPRKRDRLLSVARRAIGAQARASSPATSSTIDGRLAPPDMVPRSTFLSPELVAGPTERSTPALSLQIPSPKLHPYQNFSQNSSPSLSPFPGLYESPVITGQQSASVPHAMLPTPGNYEYDHIPGLDPPSSPRPIRWWPYRVLPPPHVLWRTLLPTLQGWRDKSIWDKIFSIFSIPNVFLLVITLPVVETDSSDDEVHDGQSTYAPSTYAPSTYAPSHAPSGPGVHAPPVVVEDHANVIHETEWQEYRRRARSFRSRSSSASGRKVMIGHSPEMGRSEGYPFPAEDRDERPSSEVGLGGSEPLSDDEPPAWNRWLAAVQIFMGPIFTCFVIWAKYMDQPFMVLIKMILYSLVGSLILLAVLLFSTSPDTKPKYYFLFCYLGFVIAIAWISTIAEEVVGILKAVGVILGMSEAILGLTIFAVGNSVGDLVADITVARLGYPVMALSACFGGPMLNILLGIGLGGTYMTMKNAKHEHKQHPDEPVHYGAYHIEVSGTLFISAMTVLVTLFTLLILVPSSKWMMTRKIGFTLITLWIVGTVANVAVEITGAWKAIA